MFAARGYEENAQGDEVTIRLLDDLEKTRRRRVQWAPAALFAALGVSTAFWIAGLGVLALPPLVAGVVVSLVVSDAERKTLQAESGDRAPIELHLEPRGLAVHRFGATRFVPAAELTSFEDEVRELPGTESGTERVHVVAVRTRTRGPLELAVLRDEPSAAFVRSKLVEHWERIRRHAPTAGYR